MNENHPPQGPIQGQPVQSQQAQMAFLVRPENIKNMTFLPTDEKTKLFVGVSKFWESLNSIPQDSPQRQEIIDRLKQVTINLRGRMKQHQSTQTQAARRPDNVAGGIPAPPRQNSQQPPPGPGPGPAATQATQQQIPEKYKQEAESFPWVGPDGAEGGKWVEEAKRRYALWSCQIDIIRGKLMGFENIFQQKRAANQEIPADMLEQKKKMEQQLNNLQMNKDNLVVQNNQYKKGVPQNKPQPPPPQTPLNGQNVRPPMPLQMPSNVGPINPTVDNTRQPQNRLPSAQSPMTQHQPTNTDINHPPVMPLANQQPNFAMARPQPNTANSFSGAQQQSPMSAVSASNLPVPYTHQAAIAAAAAQRSSYSNQGAGTPVSASSGQHAGQAMNRSDAQDKKGTTAMPISKGWAPPPPQPASMGTARPTLTGGTGMGVMGQPAIQKMPTFLLQGTGDHVLDKKKLDELVRQVTGATEAGSGEGLQPEVEESVLQLADEFVDNVVTSACKLAKLRGSATLEIRDIQLILERQYNIRIPGYATDELRTVRKTQPAAGYLQKMNAVQAAKVMGGKTDI